MIFLFNQRMWNGGMFRSSHHRLFLIQSFLTKPTLTLARIPIQSVSFSVASSTNSSTSSSSNSSSSSSSFKKSPKGPVNPNSKPKSANSENDERASPSDGGGGGDGNGGDKNVSKPLLKVIPDDRLRVAIIGRPNVGKSTLFNRLVGWHRAIEHKTPGVTRDCVERRGEIDELRFTVIDTPGLDSADLVRQTAAAMNTAHLALFVIDAKEGITRNDLALRKWIAKQKKPIILILNKCDNLELEDISNQLKAQIDRLQFKHHCQVAAATGLGIRDLGRLLRPFVEHHVKTHNLTGSLTEDSWSTVKSSKRIKTIDSQRLIEDSIIRLAIVGQPNVGKSTLFNGLVGEQKARVGDEAGTTRDPIELRCMYGDKKILLIDTAGIRNTASTRRDAIRGEAERMSVRAIGRSNVAILVIDIMQGVQRADLRVAHEVLREGRCLILAANKWDQVTETEREDRIAHLQLKLRTSFHAAAGMTCVLCSAATGLNLNMILDSVVTVYEKWNRRLESEKLSRFIQRLFLTRPLKAASDIVSIAQTAVRPPTFTVQMRKSSKLRQEDEKFIWNNIRAEFGLEGVPLRLVQRKQIDMIQFSAGKSGRSVPLARRLMAATLPTPDETSAEASSSTSPSPAADEKVSLKKSKVASHILGNTLKMESKSLKQKEKERKAQRLAELRELRKKKKPNFRQGKPKPAQNSSETS